MPIVVQQTVFGAAERSGKMLGRRRRRRVSPVFSKEGVVQPGPAVPAEIHAVKIDRGRMGRTCTTERYMALGDTTLSWRKRGDLTASRSLPIESITQITLGCPTTHGIAALEPWATLCLSAQVGKGRGSRLRRFYFGVTEPREARGLMMALQEKSYPGRAPVSLGQLLWQTARLRVVHRAKQASLAGIDYVRPRDVVRTLWRDALQHRRASAASPRQHDATKHSVRVAPAVDNSRSQTFETSPLGAFFTEKNHSGESKPLEAIWNPHRVTGARRQRQHRLSVPVLRPRTVGSTASRRNSVGDEPAVPSANPRPRTAGGVTSGKAGRRCSVGSIEGSVGQRRPRTAERMVTEIWKRPKSARPENHFWT
jgi:hypothetical protein